MNASTTSAEVVIPDKLYFPVREVAKICGVEPYVLRFWESEFKQIRPKRSDTYQRMYRRRDIETILKIKSLLYVDLFTIAGAKRQLAKGTQ